MFGFIADIFKSNDSVKMNREDNITERHRNALHYDAVNKQTEANKEVSFGAFDMFKEIFKSMFGANSPLQNRGAQDGGGLFGGGMNSVPGIGGAAGWLSSSMMKISFH